MISPFRDRTDAENISTRRNYIKDHFHTKIAEFKEKYQTPVKNRMHKTFEKFHKMDIEARVLILDLDGTLIPENLDMLYNHPDFWKHPEIKRILLEKLDDFVDDVNHGEKISKSKIDGVITELYKIAQKPDFTLSKLQEAVIDIFVEKGATPSEQLKSDAKEACNKLMKTCEKTILENNTLYEAGIMLPDMEKHLPEIMQGFYNVSTLGVPTLCLAAIATNSTTRRAAEAIDKAPILQQSFQDGDVQRLYACDKTGDNEYSPDRRLKPSSYFMKTELAEDFKKALADRGVRLKHIHFIGVGNEKHDSTFIANSLDKNGNFTIGRHTIPATVTGIHISDTAEEKTEAPMPYKEYKKKFKGVSLPRGTLITTPKGTGAEVLRDVITGLNIPAENAEPTPVTT